MCPPSWCFPPADPPGTPAARLGCHCSRSSMDFPCCNSAASRPKVYSRACERSALSKIMSEPKCLRVQFHSAPLQGRWCPASWRCMESAWQPNSCRWPGSPEAFPRYRWSPGWGWCHPGCVASGCSPPGG